MALEMFYVPLPRPEAQAGVKTLSRILSLLSGIPLQCSQAEREMLVFSDLSQQHSSLLSREIGLPLVALRGFGPCPQSHQPAKVKGARRESRFPGSGGGAGKFHLL